jgi:hypothetical protein
MRWYSFTLKFCIDDITYMKIAVKGYASCTTSQEFITDELTLVREPYTIHRKRQHSRNLSDQYSTGMEFPLQKLGNMDA